jgi:hypothetical protein
MRKINYLENNAIMALSAIAYIFIMGIAIFLNFKNELVIDKLFHINKYIIIFFALIVSFSTSIVKRYCKKIHHREIIDDANLEFHPWILNMFRVESLLFGLAIGALFWLFPLTGLVK